MKKVLIALLVILIVSVVFIGCERENRNQNIATPTPIINQDQGVDNQGQGIQGGTEGGGTQGGTQGGNQGGIRGDTQGGAQDGP